MFKKSLALALLFIGSFLFSNEDPIPIKEGYIHFHGYKTWYRIVGDRSDKYPLICLHGGPGVPHDYLKPLEDVAKTGRQVIFYDQLGCGNSDHPLDNNLWTVNLFKEELTTLIKELQIEKYYLLGQSWGGMLALEHALDKPNGLQCLILANSLASMSQWISENTRLRNELPQSTQDILDKHEADGTTESDEYQEAVLEFYHLHVCRLDPWPEDLNQAFAKTNESIYVTMNGPCEFYVTGNLKDWDICDRLTEINIPTLIVSGEYDESTPLINKTLNEGIKNSRWLLLENCSHLSHLEKPDLFIKILTDFLETQDSKNSP